MEDLNHYLNFHPDFNSNQKRQIISTIKLAVKNAKKETKEKIISDVTSFYHACRNEKQSKDIIIRVISNSEEK